MTGTIINVAAVITGGTTGTLLGNRLPERVRETVMHSLGLLTITIGLKMALETRSFLLVLASVLLGGIAGELAGISGRLESLGARLESLVSRRAARGHGGGMGPPAGESSSRFIRGFVTASLVFCVGPMTVMGAIQDGLTGDYSTLAVKSVLDGFAALAFASSLGTGVAFAALVVFIYQGALTLGAGWAKAVLTSAMITEMTATGGVLIFAIGLALLELKSIRVANLLPALLVAPILARLTGG